MSANFSFVDTTIPLRVCCVKNIYSRATASTAIHFLDKLGEEMPFAVMAIQVDGGSEFEGEEIEIYDIAEITRKAF